MKEEDGFDLLVEPGCEAKRVPRAKRGHRQRVVKTWRDLDRDEILRLKCRVCGAARGEECEVFLDMTPETDIAPSVHYERAFRCADSLRRLGSHAAKKVVRQRDKVCIFCGRSERLEVHHVFETHISGSSVAENMVLLCRRCHRDLHKIGHTEDTASEIADATGLAWVAFWCDGCRMWHLEPASGGEGDER